MRQNQIVADYIDGKMIKIEFPSVGTTGGLGPCLGLGFYNPNLNLGYILHRMPMYDSPRNMIFSEVNPKLEGNRSEFHILAAGLKYLFVDQNDNLGIFDDDELGKGLHAVAMDIDNQLDGLLEEMGFDSKKLTKCYNGQNGDYETGLVIIDTIQGFAEIRTRSVFQQNGRTISRYKVKRNK